MSKLLQDLRFFIGLFFTIIGALLLVQGAVAPVDIAGFNPNFLAGATYLAFGLAALALVYFRRLD